MWAPQSSDEVHISDQGLRGILVRLVMCITLGHQNLIFFVCDNCEVLAIGYSNYMVLMYEKAVSQLKTWKMDFSEFFPVLGMSQGNTNVDLPSTKLI